jgi:hypothetical protein
MRSRLLDSILAAAVMLTFLSVLFAQAAQQPGAAKAAPDLSGIWAKVEGTGFGFLPKGQEPPMLPETAEKYKIARFTPTAEPGKAGEEWDPNLYPYCLPTGFPRLYDSGHPFEILQVLGRIYMLFEVGIQTRRIYMDGRKPHEDWPSMFMGESIGHWEGDTLVVETANLNDLDWLDGFAHPHSDALRVEERIRRVNHDRLEVNFLFDDPKMYTRPWKGRAMYRLRADWDILENMKCEGASGKAYQEAWKAVAGKKVTNSLEGSK